MLTPGIRLARWVNAPTSGLQQVIDNIVRNHDVCLIPPSPPPSSIEKLRSSRVGHIPGQMAPHRQIPPLHHRGLAGAKLTVPATLRGAHDVRPDHG